MKDAGAAHPYRLPAPGITVGRRLSPQDPKDMTRSRRDPTRKRPIPSRPARAPRGIRVVLDRPVLLLVGLGLLLTGYLSVVALGDGRPALCSAEGGCAIVQGSRWGSLFGLPVAVWGFGLYLLLLLASLDPAPALKRWRRMWRLALVGVSISVFLTVAAAVHLRVACGWCLASLALIVALFALLTVRRPDAAPGRPWPRFLAPHLAAMALLVGGIGLAQSGVLQPPEDPRLRDLALHLERTGAKFYGAFWCPACQEQKKLFRRSAARLPYVECNPDGRGGIAALACIDANVADYPIWVIRGRSHAEVLTPEQLARLSGFRWDRDG